MSRAANTLTTSDVLTTPIKLKYSSSYDSSSYSGAGIRVLGGVNNPVSASTIDAFQQRTLNYLSARHLFYSNYLTGSFPISSSHAYNWEQSTAASGTLDADLRVFPTGSGGKIKILSIPREVYGQKISRRGFQLVSNDGYSYNIIDDGNGNLIDYASDTLYVNQNYFDPRESFTVGYVQGPAKEAHVGNIIYSQGIIIITNPDYYNILDAGPLVIDQVVTFYDTDIPKTFQPLTGAQPDSSPIHTASLALIPIPNQQFPGYNIITASVILSPIDPLYSTIGTYYIDYSVSSSIGTPSNIGNITLNIIPNCNYTIAVDGYYEFGKPRLLFDFADQLMYENSGSVIKDLSIYRNNGTSSFGVGNGTPVDTYTYNETSPGYLSFPSSTSPTTAYSVAIPDYFKYTGTLPFSFVVWLYYLGPGFTGLTPGIISAEGESGGFPIGWAWYIDDANGIRFARHDGTGGGDVALLTWSALGSLTTPATPNGVSITKKWMCLGINYDGANMSVRGFRPSNQAYQATTVASTTSITSDPAYSVFVGQNNRQFPVMRVGYVAGYAGALDSVDMATIYSATKARYGY